MNLQGIQNQMVAAGQALQDVGRAIVATLRDLAVSVGQAFRQLGNILAQPFVALHQSLTSRSVERQDPPEGRYMRLQEFDDSDFDDSASVRRNSGFGIESDVEDMLNQVEKQNGRVSFSDLEITPNMFDEELRDLPPMPIDRLVQPESPRVTTGVTGSPGTTGISGTSSKEEVSSSSTTKTEGSGSSSSTSSISTDFSKRLGKLEMPRGEKAITDSGLVPSHVEKFKQVAKESNTILMFRPVNQMSTGLLAEGTSAKGLNVHGKSSDWGPMAGFIAFDQALSKKHRVEDRSAIEKGNSDNHHSLEHDGEKIAKMPLSLSPSRLSYLKEQDLLKPCDEQGKPLTGEPPKEGPQFFLNGGGKGGKAGNDNYVFKLEQSEGGYVVSYKSKEGKDPVAGGRVEDWKPLEVMGDKKAGKPLTADYDMFAMLPKMDGKTFVNQPLPPPIESRVPELKEQKQSLVERRNTAKEELATINQQIKELESRGAEVPESLSQKATELRGTIKSLWKEALVMDIRIKNESKNHFRNVVNSARELQLGQMERRQVDPELGRLTSWQRDLRDRMNKSVTGEYEGGDLIKHGTEQDNTQFSEKDDKIFVIMPNGDTFMTQSWEQTQAFMWSAKQDDFLTYTNRSYRTADEKPTQTTFYPGQNPEDKFSGTRLEFDMRTAAEKLGVLSSD